MNQKYIQLKEVEVRGLIKKVVDGYRYIIEVIDPDKGRHAFASRFSFLTYESCAKELERAAHVGIERLLKTKGIVAVKTEDGEIIDVEKRNMASR